MNYKERRIITDKFIQENYRTHTLGMIMKQIGGSYPYIHSRYAALGLKPLNKTDLKVKFIIDNPQLKSGQVAKVLGVTTNHISQIKGAKISPQLKAIL